MTRQQRRAAERQAHKTGYLHRVLGAAPNFRGRVVHAVIEHEQGCGIYTDGVCSCTPDISLHPDGGGEVSVVDAEGRAMRIKRS